MGGVTYEELTRQEVRALRQSTRRRRRIWAGVILGNLAVLLLMVGGPYLRGRQRALDGRKQFGAFVACLWGGTPEHEHGLLLPAGDRPHYVDGYRTRPEWPMDCVGELRAIVPEPAFFLFPSVKHAEAETLRAARMVERELRAAAPPREPGAAVPSRPWLAVQRLVAALSIWAERADAVTALRTDAVRFPQRATTVAPERIPLHAARDADVWLRPLGDGAEAFALDERGISWVHVGGGVVRPRRLRRPRAVSSWLREGPHIWLLWTTPPERCAEGGCSSRAMGLARLDEAVAVTPEPRWIGAHPAGIGSDTTRIENDTVEVIAVRDDGFELRRFDLTATPEGELPLAPIERVVLPDALTSPLFDDDGSVLALRADGLVRWDRTETTLVRPAEARSLRRCLDWLLLEGDGHAELTRAGVSGRLNGAPPRVIDCDETAALVASAGRALFCDHAGCVPHVVPAAQQFDAAVLRGDGLLAYSRDAAHPQIEVVRVARELSSPMIPAACWSEEGEMCRRPVLGVRRGRAVLGAIDDDDVVMVETSDGRSWLPLRGLR